MQKERERDTKRRKEGKRERGGEKGREKKKLKEALGGLINFQRLNWFNSPQGTENIILEKLNFNDSHIHDGRRRNNCLKMDQITTACLRHIHFNSNHSHTNMTHAHAKDENSQKKN